MGNSDPASEMILIFKYKVSGNPKESGNNAMENEQYASENSRHFVADSVFELYSR